MKALRSCTARAAAVQVRAMHLTCAWHCALMCGVRSCACEVAVHVPPARRLAWLMPWQTAVNVDVKRSYGAISRAKAAQDAAGLAAFGVAFVALLIGAIKAIVGAVGLVRAFG